MTWQAIFGTIYFIGGAILAVFARPIAVWDYGYDLKWKILLMFGIKFRIWFLRIGGLLLMLMGLLMLWIYFFMNR